MASKAKWKATAKRLKKQKKNLEKMLRTGIKTMHERDAKIAQLTSVLEQQQQEGYRLYS